VRAERFWKQARAVSQRALAQGALVPLATRELQLKEIRPFVLRELLSRPPRHLREPGPRPNPFLPWDRPLQVGLLETGHVVLLNKYPVQESHLLLITRDWQPQSGWLQSDDWRAVAGLAADTGGLWFFNSNAAAGASQPHRHLQLLPRAAGESSCPLAGHLEEQLDGLASPWPWAYRLSRRRDPSDWGDLPALYREHCRALGIGDPGTHADPAVPYNLLFDDRWFLTVRRVREHCAGFSVNALGFAGYLLSTEHSECDWLLSHGPWALLAAVAAPVDDNSPANNSPADDNDRSRRGEQVP
jgi:sulfate adenylyltransferase (ADP) / ATP adenylyltransferase